MSKSLISTLREKKGINQVQLSKMIGTTPSAISKWEHGVIVPSDGMIDKLATALDIDVKELASSFPRCISHSCRNKLFKDGLCNSHYYAKNEKVKPTITDKLKELKTIGERLYTLRMKRGMPVDILANNLGVTPHTIHAWESNDVKPNLMMLIDLSSLFSVSTRFLERGIVE